MSTIRTGNSTIDMRDWLNQAVDWRDEARLIEAGHPSLSAPKLLRAIADALDAESRQSMSTHSRRFTLERDTDHTGISGTGTVADGVQFPDGTVVLRWRGERCSTVVWSGIEDVGAIHGHNGSTRIEWLDA